MQRLAAVLAALAAVHSAYAQSDLQERMKIEVEIEVARARIPAASDVAALEQYIREKAKKAEIAVDIAPAPPTPVTPLLELRHLDVSGRAALQDVQIFLAYVSNARGFRLIDYESLQLVARADGQVGFRARVAMACWIDGPLREPAQTLAAIRSMEERFTPGRMVSAIGDVERELRGKAIALTELSFGGDGRASGVVLGAAAREALVPALESSAFRVGPADFVARGDCQAFTVPLELLPGPDPIKLSWADADIFDGAAAEACTPPKAPAPRRLAANGGGNVTIRLRNAGPADVFRALSAATKEGFVVDASVAGRFDADFDHATPEAAFAALKAAGVAVGPGPLHIAGAPLAVPAGNYTGETIDVSLDNADARDVVQLLGMISKRELAAPPPGTSLSIFTTDEPWDRLLAAVQLVKPAGVPPPPPRRAKREWWSIDHIEQWSARDLTLAGVVNTEKGWIAYATTPGAARKVFELSPATKLRDAKVAAVDAKGVQLDNGAHLALP